MFTLICNYFKDGKLTTEVKEFNTKIEALERVVDLQFQGIEITGHHYGIYVTEGNKLKQVA